jgi:acyl-CoA synthetase (AMP-forming)/AMP-acid ligase II
MRTLFVETLSDRITGAEAHDQAFRIVQSFADNGAAPRDVIAYVCRSSARHAVAWFAASLSGRITNRR